MKKRVALIAAGCIAAGSVLLSGCATEVKATVPDVIQVQNLEEDRKISLSTSETVKVAPDMARIVYGIATEDADAEKCQQANAEKLNGLLEYLKGQVVAETSIATSDFSLNPMYDWSGNTRKIRDMRKLFLALVYKAYGSFVHRRHFSLTGAAPYGKMPT